MSRKILIVDDIEMSRLILRNILARDYEVLEAESGEAALALLASAGETVSAVLLDIWMPGLDGHEVLRRIRDDSALSELPVIMITASDDEELRLKTLSEGANDFMMKPYRADVILHCLKTNIALHESVVTIKALQRDRLTGLYSREPFFQRVAELVAAHEPGYYILCCFDVDGFKMINDQYGAEKGDETLRHIGNVFRQGFDPIGGLCCRITADNFAVLYPASYRDSREVEEIRRRSASVDGLVVPVNFSIGRYLVDDLSLSVATMYDRANIAMDSIKGRYDVKIAQYDESMRLRLLKEQEIVLEMAPALEAGQFEVWYQPQYNHSSGAMIGAEALVRWRRESGELVQPNDFIPVFEQNGFIYRLDRYVWEEVCRTLRGWLDEGREPLPISVNISRYDLLQPDILDCLRGLLTKYALSVELLRIEITESAFSESSQRIVEVTKELIDFGFTVEIDDFGSGYSSLNTLKDVPAQVLKLDMKFLAKSRDSQRGGNIVESIVRMAKWLDMSVIAEGVETIKQADYLRSIGCSYMQGYLFARPLPKDKYCELCCAASKEERLLALETVERLDNNSFWDPDSMDTLIFNSYVGGACIYEYSNGAIELLRATEKYAEVIGSAGMTVEDALKLNWTEHMSETYRRRLIEDLENCVATKKEVTGEYVFLDLPGCPHETYLRSTMRVIAATGSRYLVYCTNENITAQRQAEQKEHRLSEQLKAIMDNVDLGIVAAVLLDGREEYVFANDRYYKILGYTREEFAREIHSPFDTVAPEDRERIQKLSRQLNETGGSAMFEYTAVLRGGERRCIRSAVTMGSLSGIDSPVQLSIIRDISEEKETELREKRAGEQLNAIMRDIDSGLTATVIRNGRVETLFSNEQFYRMRGYTKEQYHTEVSDYYELVHPDDLRWVRELAAAIYSSDKAIRNEYRVVLRDKSIRWMRTNMTLTRFTGVEEPVVLTVFSDITAEKQAELSMKDAMTQLSSMMNDIPGGFCRIRCLPDGSMYPVYINEGLCRLTGMSHAEMLELYATDALSGVHPDDVAIVRGAVARMFENGEAHSSRYRLRHKTRGYIWLSIFGRSTKDLEDNTYLNIYYIDASRQVEEEELQKELLDNLPGGAGVYEFRQGDFKLIYQNSSFWELVGLDREAFPDPAPLSAVHPDSIPVIIQELTMAIGQGRNLACDIRLRHLTQGYRPVHLAGRVIPKEDGRYLIYATLRPSRARVVPISSFFRCCSRP